MKLIVGLGNPGKKYAKTRHNAGFLALDALRAALAEYGPNGWELSKKFNAEISGCAVGAEKIVLAKPMTFMNDSGIAVQLIAHFYKIAPRDIIVVHDDKDIPLGEIKIQTNRGSAGHNGVQSIIDHLGTEDFQRVRIGVKSASERVMRDTASFVLSSFGLLERGAARTAIRNAVAETMKLIA
jgi:PTH1 family peptidyl-tRNA hydrolase